MSQNSQKVFCYFLICFDFPLNSLQISRTSLMTGLHSHQDSSRQVENNNVKCTFVSSFTLLTFLGSSRSSRRHVDKSVPSQKKQECLDCLASLSTILAEECECLHLCVLCLPRSHLTKSFNECPRRECKPGIKFLTNSPHIFHISSKFSAFVFPLFKHFSLSRIFSRFSHEFPLNFPELSLKQSYLFS